jgi:hypothetical protein
MSANMPSPLYNLIKGAFAFMDAPFGLHPADRKRAVEYRKQAAASGLTWADAEDDVRTYAASKGWTAAETEKQVLRAKKLLTPKLK